MRRVMLAFVSVLGCHSSPPAAAGGEAADAHGHHAKGMHHRFDDPEAWAKVFDDPTRDAWQRPADVVAAMHVATGATVVDLGAGTGYFLPYLSKAVGPKGTVIALDVEPKMVDHMKKRAAEAGLANVEARVVAKDDPGLSPDSVDHVLVVDTWHHLDQRLLYANKLAKALRPGGTVVVVDFTLTSDKGPPKAHRLSAETVASELAAGGLATRVLPVGLPDQYVVEGRRGKTAAAAP